VSAVALNIFRYRVAEAAFVSCKCMVAKSATMHLHEIDERLLNSGVHQ